MKEGGLEVLGQAEVEEIECGKGRDFSAMVRFYPMPEFDLPDLNTLLNGESDKDPRDRISLRLLELVSFDLQDGFVKDELALDGEVGVDSGNAKWKTAADRISMMLILKKIASQEGVEIEQRDVDNRIAKKAKEFGASIKELQAVVSQGGCRQRLKDVLLAESTLEYLVARRRTADQTWYAGSVCSGEEEITIRTAHAAPATILGAACMTKKENWKKTR